VVKPGRTFQAVDNGVYNILVWRGRGRYGGYEVEALNFGMDELVISHDRANNPLLVENTGDSDLIIFKFFGPDINLDVPMLKRYPPK